MFHSQATKHKETLEDASRSLTKQTGTGKRVQMRCVLRFVFSILAGAIADRLVIEAGRYGWIEL